MSASTSAAPSRTWLWVLIVAAVLTQTGLNLFRPVTSYKLLALGGDSFVIGVAAAVYAVLPLVAAVRLGRFADRTVQLRHLVMTGAAMVALGGALLALGPSVWVVLVASAVLGMGHLCFTIGGQASIARYAGDDHLDQGFGWFTAAFSAGQMIGPVLGGRLVGHGSTSVSPERLADVNLSLWVGVVVTILAVPPLLTRLRPAVPPPSTSTDDVAPGPAGAGAPSADDARVLTILRIPRVMSHMTASFSLLAMLDILTAFLPLVGERAGVAPAVVGVLLGVRGMASIGSRLLLPWLAGRFTRRTLLLVCLLGSGVSLVLPPLLVDRIWVDGTLMAVAGFFLGLGQPLTMTLITTSVPGSWRASALAVRLMGNRLGQVVMPLAAGVVAAPLGPAGAIWMCCLVLVGSGVEKALRDPA